MITYVLVLMVAMNRAGAMSVVVDFPTYEACKFAGEAFKTAAKKEQEPRFYCFPAEGRGE